MMKTFMMMAVFGIGFASVADLSVTESSSHTVRVVSAQQEQQVSFPAGGDNGQEPTAQDSRTA